MIGTNLIIALAALSAAIIVCASALKGWRGWLDLKTRELDRMPRKSDSDPSYGLSWIELADLKERIRKLEAIASGVDL